MISVRSIHLSSENRWTSGGGNGSALLTLKMLVWEEDSILLVVFHALVSSTLESGITVLIVSGMGQTIDGY